MGRALPTNLPGAKQRRRIQQDTAAFPRWAGRPQAGSGGGRGDEEAHVVQLAGSLIKEVVEGEVVHEPLGGVDAIAVLVVVRGVVGVGDDDHVILRGLSAHVVVADDDLPVAAPVIPADHDGVAVGKRLLDVVKGEDVVDVFARVNGGVAVKAAHALEDIQHLGKAGRRATAPPSRSSARLCSV